MGSPFDIFNQSEDIGPGDYMPKWIFNDWKETGQQIGDLPTPEYFPISTVVEQNPYQKATQEAMFNFGQPGGRGAQLADATSFGGLAGLKSMGEGMDYMSELRSGGPNTFNYDQGTFDQIMGNLTPNLSGVHADLMRDPLRQFQEQTIPGINAGAAGGGQSFGTKPFNTGAIAARGLADRSADVGNQLWMNAANQANQGGYGAGTQNLASANRLQGDLLNNYGQYATLGSNMLDQGYDMYGRNLAMGLDAGDRQYGWDQARRGSEVNRWNFDQMREWDAVQRKLQMMNLTKANSVNPNAGEGMFGNLVDAAMATAGVVQSGQDAGWWLQDEEEA